ncbi:MAG: ABC transporter permease [Acidobacteriota bacterium]
MSTVSPSFDPAMAVRQVLATARFEFLRLRRSRFSWTRGLLFSLPVFFTALVAVVITWETDFAFDDVLRLGHSTESTARRFHDFIQGASWGMWGVVLYLGCFALCGGSIRSEVEERTLHHLFLRPVRRELAAAGKFLAAAALLALQAVGCWWLSIVLFLAPHGPAAMASTLLSADGLKSMLGSAFVLVMAALSYGAFLFMAGIVTRWPAVVGVLFALFEIVLLWMGRFQWLTPAHHLRSLSPVRLDPDLPMAEMLPRTAAPVSVLALLVFTAACLAVAGWQVRNLQLDYGEAPGE